MVAGLCQGKVCSNPIQSPGAGQKGRLTEPGDDLWFFIDHEGNKQCGWRLMPTLEKSWGRMWASGTKRVPKPFGICYRASITRVLSSIPMTRTRINLFCPRSAIELSGERAVKPIILSRLVTPSVSGSLASCGAI